MTTASVLLLVYALGFALTVWAFGRAVAVEEAGRGLPAEVTTHPLYLLRLGLWTLAVCAAWPVVVPLILVQAWRATRR